MCNSINIIILKKISITLVLTINSLCILSTNNGVLTYNWRYSTENYFLHTKIDSTTNPYTLYLETVGEKKGAFCCQIPFPQANVLKVKLKVKYKAENCEDLYLKLASIGECEKIIAIDTLHLAKSNTWTLFDDFVSLDNPKLLSISIEAAGSKEKSGKIWLNAMDLYVNEKNISDLPSLDRENKIILKKEDIISFNNQSMKDLPFFEKKILSIGETIHGTEAMNNIAIEIIKNRVINKKCKLILLEIPFEYSFYINRFLNDDQNFKIDSISNYFDNCLFSYSFVSLIEWVKKYNLYSDEKVYFFGFDINAITLKSKLDLFDFFYTININKNNDKLKNICTILLDRKRSLQEIISLFDTNNNFADIFNKKESLLMRYCITMIDHSQSYPFARRDKTMYENTNFLIKNLLESNENITIFSHFGHSNYLNQAELADLEQYSFGYYMKNKYKDNYSSIAIITESGSFLTDSLNSYFGINQLQSSPPNSLEHLINKFNTDSCFLSMEKIPCEDPIQIRFMGNKYLKKQFIPIMPKARMDGVIFVKKVSSIYKEDDIMNKNVNSGVVAMYTYMQALNRIKNKQ